jgi:cytoskeletal protein CcmA (bactofilin family)
MTLDHLASSAAFLVASGSLMLLPFAPAWREWRRPTDVEPLSVPPDGSQDPFFHARRLRERMALAREQGAGGFLPIDEVDPLDDSDKPADLPILAARAVRTLGAVQTSRALYATDDLDLRGGAVLSQVLAEGRLDLGPSSRVTGWAHAGKELQLGENSVAAQRVSSEGVLRLARGCCFERVHAPEVRFGEPREAARAPAELAQGDFSQLPGASRRGEALVRVEGDCTLPERTRFRGSLVVTGVLVIGDGSVIEGSVKARKGIQVGRGARGTGSVVCENGLHVLRDARIEGPLVSETHLLIGAGARLGRPHALSTVSASALIVEEGVVAHGTVWARRAGVVWGLGT